MNSIDELVLKQIVLYLDGKNLELKTVDPGNDDERDELEKLDKKGLVKFRVIDASGDFIVHKNILQKLIDDLSGQSPVSEIIDRNIKTPSLLQICALNVWLRKTPLSPEQFRKKVYEENLVLENYTTLKE
ncbi:MAG: hypothetical protein MI863_14705 [Desulfobacterales bacterium]|nr:hypothetical protein [Desulfobacterales bacterium]